jgi:hypothetical protein
MKRTLIAGFATAALISGGLGLAAGTAQADPPMPGGTGTWCPGQPMPRQTVGPPLTWDMSVCHHYWYDGHGPDGMGTAGYYPVEGENPNSLHGGL